MQDRRPRLAVLWQCEPDHTQHAVPLGSPEHHGVIARADANVGRIAEIVQDGAGDDNILLIVASDHGQETVDRVIPLESMLMIAGLKDGLESSDVVVASNGFSAHIYVSEENRERIGEIVRFLENWEEIGDIFAGPDLARVGQRTDTPLAISVTPKSTNAFNKFGVPGMNGAFKNRLSGEIRIGTGQHGGLGVYEQGPFLIVMGGGFTAGGQSDDETSAIDIAPTILRHLDLPWDGMDGKPLPRD